jgi:hypothetical protein
MTSAYFYGTGKQCILIKSIKKMENGEVMTGMENGEATKIGLRLIGLRLSLCMKPTAGTYIDQKAGL